MSSERDTETSVAELPRDELEERVRELEQAAEEFRAFRELFTIPGEDTDGIDLRELEINGIPIGKAITSKVSQEQIDQRTREIKDEISDTDSGVSTTVSREDLLPAHRDWVDIRTGNVDSIDSDRARRAARLFNQLKLRASGDPDPKVKVTDRYYVMDSGQAKDHLKSVGDITDGGVSKTVGRAFERLQQKTRTVDCDCKDIETCKHGLVEFDASGGTNQVRAEKQAFHEYLATVESAKQTSDDDGEQPSEDSASADASAGDVEAVGQEFDQLLTADGGNEVSDTVVSNVESKASERPVSPKQHQDR